MGCNVKVLKEVTWTCRMLNGGLQNRLKRNLHDLEKPSYNR